MANFVYILLYHVKILRFLNLLFASFFFFTTVVKFPRVGDYMTNLNKKVSSWILTKDLDTFTFERAFPL